MDKFSAVAHEIEQRFIGGVVHLWENCISISASGETIFVSSENSFEILSISEDGTCYDMSFLEIVSDLKVKEVYVEDGHLVLNVEIDQSYRDMNVRFYGEPNIQNAPLQSVAEPLQEILDSLEEALDEEFPSSDDLRRIAALKIVIAFLDTL
ncbi:MAG: hypothetical protein EI684_05985 [Candidatus Viridilinea halotolerans]|uniref:Uncharacterized protein n=1 Tax=Candidatus Viridilinea halotolerans TaxID=2491704 RepID=A0A426U4Q1_9CHLR|nr:MAG: hypothetical protein EI684_05985 [Candidatus Viridilinea halotolerans]